LAVDGFAAAAGRWRQLLSIDISRPNGAQQQTYRSCMMGQTIEIKETGVILGRHSLYSPQCHQRMAVLLLQLWLGYLPGLCENFCPNLVITIFVCACVENRTGQMVHLQEGSVSSLLDFPTYSQQPPGKRLHVTETVSDASSLPNGMLSISVSYGKIRQ